MNDLRTDLRNYLQRDFTDDVVIELLAAHEQAAVTAFAEKVATQHWLTSNTGDCACGQIIQGYSKPALTWEQHIHAIIPPEGAELLRRDYIPRKEVVAKINKLLRIESNVDLERWEQLELAIAQREHIARRDEARWWNRHTVATDVTNADLDSRMRELEAQAASQETKK